MDIHKEVDVEVDGISEFGEEDREAMPDELENAMAQVSALSWNVKRIIESEKVSDYLKKERDVEFKKLGIEPFDEAKQIWVTAGKKIEKEHRKLEEKITDPDELHTQQLGVEGDILLQAQEKLEELAMHFICDEMEILGLIKDD